jgi:hypothetical protein
MMDKISKHAQEVIDTIGELSPNAAYPTGFHDCIIGYAERFGQEPMIIIDKAKLLKVLRADGMSQLEAEEYYDYNILGAGMSNMVMPAFFVRMKASLPEKPYTPRLRPYSEKKYRCNHCGMIATMLKVSVHKGRCKWCGTEHELKHERSGRRPESRER